MSTLIQLMLVVLFSNGAFAKAPSEGASDCELLLSSSPSEIDYATSDLEGAYLELLQKVQAADEVPVNREEFYIKDIFSLKSTILNKALTLTPQLLNLPAENLKRTRVLTSIYQMLVFLGMPPELYGLALNDKHQVVAAPDETPTNEPATAEAPTAPSDEIAEPVPSQSSAPIGFINSAPTDIDGEPVANSPYTMGFVRTAPGALRDLPESMQRSIGFGAHRLVTPRPPARLSGFIGFKKSPKGDHLMLITDHELNRTYEVNVQFLTPYSAEVEGKKYIIAFNREDHEWVILVENLHNPTRHIGFLH